MIWTKLTFERKENVTPKLVHKNDVWAEDVNEIGDAIEEFYLDLLAIKNAVPSTSVSDAWSIGGMKVRAYATNCPILTQYYSGGPTTVTHANADGTFGRKDYIILDIQGNISILQGTPGAVILPPPFDKNTQFLIRELLIPANATQPVDVNNNGITTFTKIYAENLGEAGGEANASGSAATLNLGSVNTPLSATVSIEATLPQKLHELNFDFTSVKNTTNATHFVFKLKLKAAVAIDRSWILGLYLNNQLILNQSFLFSHGQYGFDATSLQLQYISIPTEVLPWQNVDYNKISLLFYHNQSTILGYFIDDIEFIKGFGSTTVIYQGGTPTITLNENTFFLRKNPNNNDPLKIAVLENNDMAVDGFWNATTYWPQAIYKGGGKDVEGNWTVINKIKNISLI